GGAPAGAARVEQDDRGVRAGQVPPRAVRDASRADAGCGGDGVRGRAPWLSGVERACESIDASVDGTGSQTGYAGGDRRGTKPGDGGGAFGDIEGGRDVCATGSVVSSGAARIDVGKQRAAGVVDAVVAEEAIDGDARKNDGHRVR